jgi:hypothetical protein
LIQGFDMQPAFRSGYFQAALLPSYSSLLPARPLCSTGVTPLPRSYGPFRLPSAAAFTVMSSRSALGASPHAPRGVFQVPRLICPRALPPTTPESPMAAFARCFTTGSRFVISVRLLAIQVA